jgi:hypothetical protein
MLFLVSSSQVRDNCAFFSCYRTYLKIIWAMKKQARKTRHRKVGKEPFVLHRLSSGPSLQAPQEPLPMASTPPNRPLGRMKAVLLVGFPVPLRGFLRTPTRIPRCPVHRPRLRSRPAPPPLLHPKSLHPLPKLATVVPISRPHCYAPRTLCRRQAV